MDGAGPRSLFVVLEYCYNHAPYFTILQLDTQSADLTPKETPKVDQDETPKVIYVDPEEYLVRFDESREPIEHPRIKWLFCPPTSSTEDLYMVPNWEYSPSWRTIKPLHGYKFNFSTGRFGSIKAPTSSQWTGHVVNVKGDIYFMSIADKAFRGTRDTFFECYDHYINSWKAPETSPHSHSISGPIRATAVWGDIFLLNVNGYVIWAYDSSGNKWYNVDAKDSRCYKIQGDAIVVGDTIYALTSSYDLVLALHIKKEGTGSDVVFECSVRSEYIVEGIEQTSILEDGRAWRGTKHFVHLGKDKFCLVLSCQLMGHTHSEYEPIQLFYMEERKGENKMTVTGTCIHRVKILQPDQIFVLRFCFSLPESSESKTTTLQEGKRLVFKFNPFAEDYASKPGQEPGGADPLLLEPQLFTARDPDPSKLPASATSLSPPKQHVVEIRPPRQKPGKATILKAEDPLPELGHTICVRKLPPKANARQVEKVMTRFGPTKRVQVAENEEGKCVAYVVFRSAASKQRALEVSTISIEGHVAEILEVRDIGNEINRPILGQAVGKNKSKKFNNHGEVSQSKTTCGGHNGGECFWRTETKALKKVNELCSSLNLEELRAHLRKLATTDVLNEIEGLNFSDVNKLCWSLSLEELRALCMNIEAYTPNVVRAAFLQEAIDETKALENVRTCLRELASTDVLNDEIKGLYFSDVNELCSSLDLEGLRALCMNIEAHKPNIVRAAFLKAAINEMKGLT